jgi:hypothetical protein
MLRRRRRRRKVYSGGKGRAGGRECEEGEDEEP